MDNDCEGCAEPISSEDSIRLAGVPWHKRCLRAWHKGHGMGYAKGTAMAGPAGGPDMGQRRTSMDRVRKVDGKEEKRDDRRRLALIAEVYGCVLAHTESFSEDRVGEDLAYLLGAISVGKKCEWEHGRPLLRLLRKGFKPDHPVWKHIDIVGQYPDGCQVAGGTGRQVMDDSPEIERLKAENAVLRAALAQEEMTGQCQAGKGPAGKQEEEGMKKQKRAALRLTLDVEYVLNGASVQDLKDNLDALVANYAMGEGIVTEGTDATVLTYDHSVTERPAGKPV